ncbi:hypothetical protein MJO10_28645, partial [Salmonella enterica subsp. enterica serovar Anatum]|nr:hypothetical protein [Salmonella enterica subsp. enterica serovar Anatum]
MIVKPLFARLSQSRRPQRSPYQIKEKIGYGMGDAASHIIFDNVMLYMMFFYTDIFGIPAGFVGT